MKMRCLVAALVALASVFGLAEDFTIKFEVKGIPEEISEVTNVVQGSRYVKEFPLIQGYCITNVVVKRNFRRPENTAIGIIVGVNEYADGSSFDCCETDAKMMGKTFEGFVECIKFTGKNATKAAIRSNIADLAQTLEAGESFIYYHSSLGEPGSIYTYDDSYTAEELASDLDAFAAGVKIYVIIDASFSGSFEEALKGKATFLLSSKATQQSGVFPSVGMSVLTASICYCGRSNWTDDDESGIISAGELADGAIGYLKTIKYKKQTPVFGIKSPEDLKTSVSLMNNQDWFGEINYGVFNGTYFNLYVVHNTQMDYDVTIYEAPVENALDCLLDVSKYSVAYKLSGSDLQPGLPMKASISAAIPLCGEDTMPFEIIGPCNINGYCPDNFFANLAKYNGKGLSYVLADYYWLPCGKLVVKPNYKKGYTSYKASIKAVDNYLYPAFDTRLKNFHAYFTMRLSGRFFTGEGEMTSKFIEGKSYSMKLLK